MTAYKTLPDILMLDENHTATQSLRVPVEKIFDKDNRRLHVLRINLLQEELDELKAAIEAEDLTETRDALADIRYVLNGAIVSFGLEHVHSMDFLEVHQSNMSKICSTQEEAEASVAAYRAGTHPDKMGQKIECDWIKNERTGGFIVQAPSGKYLKSVNYKRPVFEEIVAAIKPKIALLFTHRTDANTWRVEQRLSIKDYGDKYVTVVTNSDIEGIRCSGSIDLRRLPLVLSATFDMDTLQADILRYAD